MTHVFFVGLGLIGGSLASNIQYFHPDITISAYDAHHEQLERALSIGIIDQASSDYESTLQEADIVIFATPVQTTVQYLSQLPQMKTKPGLIVTDTGSTKSTIQAFEKELLSADIHLVGGHPMAGSHKSGVLNAKKHLFENAYYILVHQLTENQAAAQRIEQLLAPTRARFIHLTADEHDQITGVVSHVPHLIASSLVHLNAFYAADAPLIQDLAAGGFRDITRVASSNPEMWRDISIENKAHIVSSLKQLQQQLTETVAMLEQGHEEALYQFFDQAKTYRDGLPIRGKGAMQSTYDLYVDIPDKPGMISKVTEILSQHQISIRNLRILEVREDIYGALRISFKKAEDRDAAITALSDFDTYLS
ncbi:prephenate dehydrogenase [Staphylococcus delphini]|uniref:Prephenate dehydrogenase n=1 Tax=Staphylococcus delphini TaxID=53344 RepID=A0AAQ0IFF3_9STAP|nr:prephenate dehydrogenase [Staphylococcus delphini]MDE9799581.1 prephenate dehydrogenase [Staphylococcus delphini]MDE9806268.1 prephenate dehydrogenase [Staphylococcus delphini]MDE9829412.1 prephenate dehydrogenase [Staphylococcus delphini]PCF39735.1 prephenate dehydrogenase [Staphylococcus delphini]PCF52889.1 prephenate dehydrogenase [Staphylococcus delphini]